MVKNIIEKTHIILSKITKFIWFFSMCKFFKSDKYCGQRKYILC